MKTDNLAITEKQFESQIKDLANILGYLYYHTWRSIHSPAGWPDCVLVRLEPEPRMIIAELKTDDKHSQPSESQYIWLYILQHLSAPVECYLWRPADIEEIAEILQDRPSDMDIIRCQEALDNADMPMEDRMIQ